MKTLTVHLDEDTVRALQQLQRTMQAESVLDTPPFSLPALARHAIRKWCDNQARPIVKPWEKEANQQEEA